MPPRAGALQTPVLLPDTLKGSTLSDVRPPENDMSEEDAFANFSHRKSGAPLRLRARSCRVLETEQNYETNPHTQYALLDLVICGGLSAWCVSWQTKSSTDLELHTACMYCVSVLIRTPHF